MIQKGLGIIMGNKQLHNVIWRERKPSKKGSVIQFFQVKMDGD